MSHRSLTEPTSVPEDTNAHALIHFVTGKEKLHHLMALLRKRCRVIFMLDLDECCVVGSDTNDVIRLTQKQAGLDPSKEPLLQGVADRVVNPALVRAVKTVSASAGSNAYFMFYTLKAGLLRNARFYNVDLRGLTVANGTIHFKEGLLAADYTYLCDQLPSTEASPVNPAYLEEIARLGLATRAVSLALELPYLMGGLVTETTKDPQAMAGLLGFDPEHTFLFDDRSDKHQAAHGHSPYSMAHFIKVQPFDFFTIEEEQAARLKEYLDAHFPAVRTAELFPKLFREIVHDPNWPEDKHCIDAEGQWTVHKRIRHENGAPVAEPTEQWPTERVVDVVQQDHGTDGRCHTA